MTVRLIVWVITLAATFLVSQIQPRFFSPVLLLFIGLLAPISYLTDRLFHQLRVRLVPRDDLVQRGELATWQLEVKNQSAKRTHFVTFLQGDTNRIPLNLEPKQEAVVDLLIDTKHCGLQAAPPIKLSFVSLFGLFRMPLAPGIEQRIRPIYVLPVTKGSLTEPSAFGDLIKLGQLQAIGREANHDEVDHMRGIQPGDPMRLIHWKLSARLQEWMVRQFSKAQEKSVHVMLELPPAAGELDEATLTLRDELLDRVAQELRTFLFHDFQVTLLTHGSSGLSQTVRGLDQFDQLRKQLAMIAKEDSIPLSVQLAGDLGDRSAMVFYLTASLLDEATTEALKELRRQSGGVLFELLSPKELSKDDKLMIRELRSEGVEVLVSYQKGGNDETA